MITLGSLVDPVSKAGPNADDELFTYVDLGSVDSELKEIVSPSQVAVSEAPSRARQRLRTGDVLVSTVRPNLNGVAMVPGNLDGAIASTGFSVLRPKAEVLDPRYLFHFVRSESFIRALVERATGASYPAVSNAIVGEMQIPLPPLPEQRRIASILDAAAELVRKRRQQLNGTDSLVDATYSEMFGDLDANDRSWPMGVVHDLVSGFSSGKSIIGDEESGSATYRVLKISAVTTGRFDPTESKPLPPDYTPPERHLVSRGDLLISRANTSALVGATALVQDEVQGIALPDKIWRFDWAPGVGDPSLFVWQTFSRPEFRRRISEIATGTGGSMKNISQGAVLSLPIPIPPIERREAFANEFSKLDRLRKLHLRDLAKLDELFASLQYRAFRGEL